MQPAQLEQEPRNEVPVEQIFEMISNFRDHLTQHHDDFMYAYSIDGLDSEAACLVTLGARTYTVINCPPDQLLYDSDRITIRFELNDASTQIPTHITVESSDNVFKIGVSGDFPTVTCTWDIDNKLSFSPIDLEYDGEVFPRSGYHLYRTESIENIELPEEALIALQAIYKASQSFSISTKPSYMQDFPPFQSVRTLTLDEYRGTDSIDLTANEVISGDVLDKFKRIFAGDDLRVKALRLKNKLNEGTKSTKSARCAYTLKKMDPLDDDQKPFYYTAAIKVTENSKGTLAEAETPVQEIEYLEFYRDEPLRRLDKDLYLPDYQPYVHFSIYWFRDNHIEIVDHNWGVRLLSNEGMLVISSVKEPDNLIVISDEFQFERILLDPSLAPIVQLLDSVQQMRVRLNEILKNENGTRRVLTY